MCVFIFYLSLEIIWNISNLSEFRESSFNMTRGGDEDIKGGLRKFLDTRKGGSENLHTLNPKGGGAPKNLNR